MPAAGLRFAEGGSKVVYVGGLAIEVPVAESEGLKHPSVVNCDQLTRLEKNLLTDFIGRLSAVKLLELRTALRIALSIE